MEIVLGHIPSLEFWRLKRPHNRTRALLARRTEPEGFRAAVLEDAGKPTAADLERLERLGLGQLSRPVQLVVPDVASRARNAQVACNVFDRRIPPAAFIDVGHGVFVESPELCFLLKARESPFEKLVETGYELSGTYRMSREHPEGMVSDQLPLASSASLRSFAARAQRLPGIKAARKALPFVLEGSASPKETHLAMISCLPGRFGGYGFSPARLNYEVPIPEKARGRGVGRICRCDLYWPEAKLDVEYDSRLHHASENDQIRDSARRTALAYQGILVISVTSEQLHARLEMDKVANAMAKRLGVRLRSRATDWETKRIRLRSSLLQSPHPPR